MFDEDLYYSQDIFEFNRQTAQAPGPPILSRKSRAECLGSMLRTAREMKLHHQTQELAAAYLFRFMAASGKSDPKCYDGVFCAALRIASLMTNDGWISVDAFKNIAAPKVVVEREEELSKILRYAYRIPTVADFVSYLRLRSDSEVAENWRQANFLGELATLSAEMVAFHPALLAAACFSLLLPYRSRDLAGRVYFEESQVEECENALVAFLIAPSREQEKETREGQRFVESYWGFSLSVLLRQLSLPKISSRAAILFDRKEETEEKEYPPPEGEKGEKLGKGAYAKVRIRRIAGVDYAEKVYGTIAEMGVKSDFVIEAAVAKQLLSDHVVKPAYLGIADHKPYFVMELCQRTLGPGYLKRESLAKYSVQILQALAYIHSVGIVHADISPENVLICNDNAKLADFGLAQWATPPYQSESDAIGRHRYRAPEHFRYFSSPRPSTDLWAFGSTIASVFGGSFVLSGPDGDPDRDIPVDMLRKLGLPSPEEQAQLPWFEWAMGVLKAERRALARKRAKEKAENEKRKRKIRIENAKWEASQRRKEAKEYEDPRGDELESEEELAEVDNPAGGEGDAEVENKASWEEERERRFFFDGFRGYGWLQDIVKQCLAYNPKRRTPAKLLLSGIPPDTIAAIFRSARR